MFVEIFEIHIFEMLPLNLNFESIIALGLAMLYPTYELLFYRGNLIKNYSPDALSK